MIRYVATAALAVLLLAVALVLKTRDGRAEQPAAGLTVRAAVERPDSLEVRPVAAGLEVSVRHAFAGGLSRASLVYEMDGKERTAAATSSCEEALLDGARIRARAGLGHISLAGVVPQGAHDVRLILESETGVEQIPVPLD